jgi:hypothetical protein
MDKPMVIRFASSDGTAAASTVVLSTLDAPMTVDRSPAKASVPAPLAEAWERTLQGWEIAALHDTVLGLAAKHEQFAWLAARYREIARSRPEDPVPPARLARLQKAAVVAFRIDTRSPATRERTPYRGAGIILIAAVIAAVVGLRVVDMKARDHQTRTHTTQTSKAK